MIEVIAGEGGDDARLFAEQLFEAYLKWAENNRLSIEGDNWGPSKWSFVCKDARAFDLFSSEHGGHCVQRVPSNGKGKKHTSAVRVIISHLTTQTHSLKECDLEESFQRGHGKGGQNQNKVSSAVRLRHKPTGLEVFINGRDQGRNRQTARQAMAGKISERLKSSVERPEYAGAGRGDKIRTYNLQDRRITDHRSGAKCSSIESVLKHGQFELLRS